MTIKITMVRDPDTVDDYDVFVEGVCVGYAATGKDEALMLGLSAAHIEIEYDERGD